MITETKQWQIWKLQGPMRLRETLEDVALFVEAGSQLGFRDYSIEMENGQDEARAVNPGGVIQRQQGEVLRITVTLTKDSYQTLHGYTS